MATALTSGLSAIAEAMGRAFKVAVELEVEASRPWTADAAPAVWNEGGAALLWQDDGESGTLLFVPDEAGVLPPTEEDGTWSETTQSQMSELAQEIAYSLTDEVSAAESGRALRVTRLTDALEDVSFDETAALIPLKLDSGEREARFFVVGPIHNLHEILQAAPPVRSEAASRPLVAPPSALRSEHVDEAAADASSFEAGIEQLPPYSRSLLQISVPVSVTLAAKKQSVSDILRLVPGTIIQFDKSCDAVLDVEVAGQRVAVGEAVKVGDNFGLRITSMALPEERFQSLGHAARPGS